MSTLSNIEEARKPGRPREVMKELEAEMRAAAARLGHDCIRTRDHGQSQEFRCVKCGDTGGTAEFPPTRAERVSGDITVRKCRVP